MGAAMATFGIGGIVCLGVVALGVAAMAAIYVVSQQLVNEVWRFKDLWLKKWEGLYINVEFGWHEGVTQQFKTVAVEKHLRAIDVPFAVERLAWQDSHPAKRRPSRRRMVDVSSFLKQNMFGKASTYPKLDRLFMSRPFLKARPPYQKGRFQIVARADLLPIPGVQDGQSAIERGDLVTHVCPPLKNGGAESEAAKNWRKGDWVYDMSTGDNLVLREDCEKNDCEVGKKVKIRLEESVANEQLLLVRPNWAYRPPKQRKNGGGYSYSADHNVMAVCPLPLYATNAQGVYGWGNPFETYQALFARCTGTSGHGLSDDCDTECMALNLPHTCVRNSRLQNSQAAHAEEESEEKVPVFTPGDRVRIRRMGSFARDLSRDALGPANMVGTVVQVVPSGALSGSVLIEFQMPAKTTPRENLVKADVEDMDALTEYRLG